MNEITDLSKGVIFLSEINCRKNSASILLARHI
ncbi:MAG: hypothetical protein K0R31_1931 [Clostridiales bacterium]|nr:hypothetical protein [Clostridiales bacterium]